MRAALHTLVFAVGTALAMLAGALAAPLQSVYPGMGDGFLIISFVVVVIGGLGSIAGAFWAALLIGLIDTLGKAYVPQAAGTAIYVLMAAVLLFRPAGLFAQGLNACAVPRCAATCCWRWRRWSIACMPFYASPVSHAACLHRDDRGDVRAQPATSGGRRRHGQPRAGGILRARRLYGAPARPHPWRGRRRSWSACRHPPRSRASPRSLIGPFALRTRGFFFLMTTLAFGQMLFFVFHDTPLGGGADGVFIQRPDLGFALTRAQTAHRCSC